MLLTNSEIMDINQNAEFDSAIGYARKIESAVLEKLKAQEPVGETVPSIVWEGLVSIAWEADKQPPPGTKLYEHPLPPDDVVRDPRVAELESVLRECREALVAITRWNAPPDFNGRKIDRIVEKTIAKVDEVLK